ncbi:Pleckstrin homology domain-containing family A member 4 [Bienertia sinuspersici]
MNTMAVPQEPILSRLHRLDNLMKHLEEIMKGSNRSPKSSTPSTPSSGTRTSDGHASSLEFSPRSRDKLHCRPIDDVMVEAEHKGTLLDRVALMEDRLLKLGMQLEEEWQTEKQEKEEKSHSHHKKGLKQFVRSCVKGNQSKSKKKVQT